MLTINQLKQHYLKDLFSYRKLESFLYKGSKASRGYVIGVVDASKIVDSGFWNNDNLVNQFNVKSQQSSGSRFFDSIMDDVMDNETKKQIQKAEKESTGKLVFYAKEDGGDIYADLIFYNRSKNRVLDEALISLDGVPSKFSQKTFSAHSGIKSYEDVITLGIGDFDFFKNGVQGKECILYFNTEKDEDDEAKDFLAITFEIYVPLVDLAAVDLIVNGESWDQKDKESLMPVIEKGIELSNDQFQHDGIDATVKTSKKRAKWISWITAFVFLLIMTNAFEDMSDGLVLFTLLGFIAIGMSGKYIGKKLNENKEIELKNNLSVLTNRRRELERQVRELYYKTTNNHSDD